MFAFAAATSHTWSRSAMPRPTLRGIPWRRIANSLLSLLFDAVRGGHRQSSRAFHCDRCPIAAAGQLTVIADDESIPLSRTRSIKRASPRFSETSVGTKMPDLTGNAQMTQAEQGQTRLILFGASKYPKESKLNPLPCSAQDVEAVKWLLEDSGHLDSVILSEGEKKAPTRQALLKEIKNSRRKLTLLILYLSCHGLTIENKFCLVPSDVRRTANGGGLLTDTLISFEELRDAIQSVEPKRTRTSRTRSMIEQKSNRFSHVRNSD